MKQTAVDWLIKEYSKYVDDSNVPFSVLKKAKEMEREQIKNRAIESYHSYTQYLDRLPKIGGTTVEMDFEQYYNETFNTNG